jgi:hypothetical protein
MYSKKYILENIVNNLGFAIFFTSKKSEKYFDFSI